MTGPYLNRKRAAQLLQQARLDAMVIAEPEGFRYATGVNAGVPALFRRTGAAFAVIPTDLNKPTGVVIGDLYARDLAGSKVPFNIRTHPLWIEIATLPTDTAVTPIEQQLRSIWQSDGRGADFQRPNPFDISQSLPALRDLLDDFGLAQARLGL